MESFSHNGYLDMELLRFTTAGSVDDGKSTLIGRLLYDSKSIFEDQLEAVKKASIQKGNDYINLALLTDGLRSEREQGITIDVAYRYFATPKRKFIIADTPGHVQYTRNMVTGASTANAALILIDARNGVTEQTHRHTYIASLLQIPHIVVCINKMDLVDYDQKTYEEIRDSFAKFATTIDVKEFMFVPISALKGDNVVDASSNMPWYTNGTLLEILETLHIENDYNMEDPRYPIQYVIRPLTDEHHDYRAYAGRVAGGVFSKGDEIIVLPSGLKSTISSIDTFNGELENVFPSMSVSFSLADDIDVCRGDMLAKPDNMPEVSQDIEATICWMNQKPLNTSRKYVLMHTSNEVKCMVKEIICKVNVNTLEEIVDDKEVGLNTIAKVKIRTTKPLIYDAYKRNRVTGSFILVDEATNETIGVGMIS